MTPQQNRRVAAAVLLSLASLTPGLSQTAIKASEGLSLSDAWEWASEESARRGFRDVWVGYSIDRQMHESSWIGSIRSYSSSRDTSILERITGTYQVYDENLHAPDDLKAAARRALDRAEGSEEDRLVTKEIALLFRFDGSPSSLSDLITIRTTNIELAADMDGAPLIWLGKQEHAPSISHLVDMFGRAGKEKSQKRLIAALGMHGKHESVFRFLRGVVAGDHAMRVKEDAVFWISQQESDTALEYLLDLVERTEEDDLMERAVFGIGQFESETATDALIRLGKHGKREAIREQAVFWLGQQASKMVLASLRGFAYEDQNESVQKKAIFALAQIEDDGGVEEIIGIATSHPNPKIRKHAIFMLGQSEDPRAFDAIVAIIKGK